MRVDHVGVDFVGIDLTIFVLPMSCLDLDPGIALPLYMCTVLYETAQEKSTCRYEH